VSSNKIDPENQVDVENLFQLLNVTNDMRKIEKALITFATISLNESSPSLAKFYDKSTIQTLLKHVNQLENRTSYYALDSLR
jgi:hypothetical protein